MTNTQHHIFDTIKQINTYLGVVSTLSDKGKPQAAVVHFSYDENLTLYFITRKSTRKYQNLLQNPNVCFVIYSQELHKTIQFEGIATTIKDPGEQAEKFSKLVEMVTKNNTNPPVDKLGESELAFIKIETNWVRSGNFEIAKNGELFEEIRK